MGGLFRRFCRWLRQTLDSLDPQPATLRIGNLEGQPVNTITIKDTAAVAEFPVLGVNAAGHVIGPIGNGVSLAIESFDTSIASVADSGHGSLFIGPGSVLGEVDVTFSVIGLPGPTPPPCTFHIATIVDEAIATVTVSPVPLA